MSDLKIQGSGALAGADGNPPVDPPPPPQPLPMAETNLGRLAQEKGEEQRNKAARENLDRARLNSQNYESYLKAFVEGAKKCRTADELYAYGRPMDPPSSNVTGSTLAEAKAFMGIQGDSGKARLAALGALGTMAARLEGRKLPGDAYLHGRAYFKASPDTQLPAVVAKNVEQGSSLEARLDGYRELSDSSCRLDLSGRVGTRQIKWEDGKLQSTSGASLVLPTQLGTLKFDARGDMTANAGLITATTKPGSVEVGVGAKGSLKRAGIKLEAGVSTAVGIHTVSAEHVYNAFFGPDKVAEAAAKRRKP